MAAPIDGAEMTSREESSLEGVVAEEKPQVAGDDTRVALKRKRLEQDTEVAGDDSGSDDEMGDSTQKEEEANTTSDLPQQPMSKNQLKKLKRQRVWEERKDDRKRIRKEKRHDRQARKKAVRDQKIAELEAAGLDSEAILRAERQMQPKKTQVPVTIILDCDFEQYMLEGELVSLSSQIVRSYSMNRQAAYQSHLFVSSWKGKLKTRFETVLQNHHHKWHGVHFLEGDFVQAGKEAHDYMKGSRGGVLEGAVAPTATSEEPSAESSSSAQASEAHSMPDEPNIIYLTADSPHTLERLEPYTSYVIGGIVDRNREKNLCYTRAEERGVKTAKLPIGEYIKMQSRQVLTTNHVVEIMAKWLECGDWGEAFLSVIPKRKGGKLRDEADDTESHAGEAENAATQADENGSVEEKVAPEDVIPNATDVVVKTI